MSIFDYQFGSDPELFLVKANNGFAHSAHTLHDFKPMEAKARNTNGSSTIKTDGFAMELNSRESSCRDWHLPNTAQVLRKFLKAYPDYELSAKPALRLTQASLRNAPDDVMGYGCVPDMDAYEIEEKSPPTTGYHDEYRYIGGHLHFQLRGTVNYSRKPMLARDKRMLAAAAAIVLDVHLGVPLVAVLGDVNDYGEAARRRYYGQAGSYREKEYGVEYRVPSGAIMLSPILYSWAIGAGRNALRRTGFQRLDEEHITAGIQAAHARYDFDRVKDIINNHDVTEARAFLNDHQDMEVYNSEFVDLMLRADDNGIGFDDDFVKAWQLKTGMPILNHGFIGVERAMKGKWRVGRAMPEVAGGYDYDTRGFVIRDNIFPQYEALQGSVASSWGLEKVS